MRGGQDHRTPSLVVRRIDESFGHTEKTSTLLVDAKLRTEYEQLHEGIDKSKVALLKALKAQSGSRNGHRGRNVFHVHEERRPIRRCAQPSQERATGADGRPVRRHPLRQCL